MPPSEGCRFNFRQSRGTRARRFVLVAGLLSFLLSSWACGGGAVARLPGTTRADDAHVLRLRHLRLWTTGGYPLWLEVDVPRGSERPRAVTLTFTTNISARARFEGCSGVSFAGAERRVSTEEVDYHRTPMDIEADLGTSGSYEEHGVVEDIQVRVEAAAFGALLEDDEIAGRVCDMAIRFKGEHVEELRRLLGTSRHEARG